MPEEASGPWLAIDYGARVVGVAMAHPMTGSARPLAPLQHTSAERLDRELGELIAEWRPSHIVVGLPLAKDGKESAMSKRIRRFVDQLAAEHPSLDIALQDERMTSEMAARQFADRRRSGRARRKDAANLDSHAAALILDAWIRDHGLL
ncbi:MAG: Holliday junction resolvase RuvX [Pseudomonadota bacterium]